LAVQRGLDFLDGVGPPRQPVIDDGREDRGQPVVRRSLTAVTKPRTRARAVGVRTVRIVRAVITHMLAHALRR
jgi:hypothetical protein